MVTSVACATRREKYLTRKGLWSQDHPKHINFRLAQFTCKITYVASQKICLQVKILSACNLSCNLHKLRQRSSTTTSYCKFCLQAKVSSQEEQYLRARLDTCADVNIMPASVYQLMFHDPDCTKLAPSSTLEIGIYTIDKIKVIGTCTLLVVHPDTQCLREVTFHVTSHEGSVVLSCVTTLELTLIQPCNNLDHIPSSVSLISSKADHPRKNKFQKNMQVSKPCNKVCSSKEQSPAVLISHDHNANQCVVYEDQYEKSQQGCTAHDISMCDDKYYQSIKSLCDDKSCQSTTCAHVASEASNAIQTYAVS